jgi:hypothetical protein
MTCVREARPGQNAARNAALATLGEAEFDGLVVFTDDDVSADPAWLSELSAAASRHPGYDLLGGQVVPEWPAPPPDWMLRAVPVRPAYAMTDPSLAEAEVLPWQIFSPNMAIRGRVFEAGHRFDANVGPDGGAGYAMGSETEFLVRMGTLGHRALHCPAAMVRHLVRPHQMTAAWLLGRARRFGRGQYRQRRLHRVGAPPIGDGRELALDAAAAGLQWLAGAARDRSERLRRGWVFNAAIGALLEWRSMRRGSRAMRG